MFARYEEYCAQNAFRKKKRLVTVPSANDTKVLLELPISATSCHVCGSMIPMSTLMSIIKSTMLINTPQFQVFIMKNFQSSQILQYPHVVLSLIYSKEETSIAGYLIEQGFKKLFDVPDSVTRPHGY